MEEYEEIMRKGNKINPQQQNREFFTKLDTGVKFTEEMSSELKNVLVASQQIRHSGNIKTIEHELVERD